ncbi:hypothetical protein ACWD4G_41935 [Streptomyces sp. NPDC002643]
MGEVGRVPLLFLDVDGTLLPYGGAGVPAGFEEWQGWQHAGNPQLAKLVPTHGERLLGLPCELVWATAWMHDANEVISPLLGLPELPVAALPAWAEDDPADLLHWKTRALVEIALGRPFVWVDDEIRDRDRLFVEARHPGPALLHRVDSVVGLTEGDFAANEGWLRGVVSEGL